MREAPPGVLGRVKQHVEHHRRAAECGHAVGRDGVKDRRRLDPPQTHMGGGDGYHRPGKRPTIAMKHRQGPQIDAVAPQFGGHDVGQRVQIGAAMMVDDTFGIARGPRGVIERDRVPFVTRTQADEVGVAGRDEGLILDLAARRAGKRGIVDADDRRRAVHTRDGVRDHRAELTIGDQNFAFAMRENIADGGGIETGVDRVKDRAGHRHAKMALKHLGNIGQNRRDRVAASDPPRRKRRGQTAAARAEASVIEANRAINDRDSGRINRRRAFQKTERRQGGKVGRALFQPHIIESGGFGLAM